MIDFSKVTNISVQVRKEARDWRDGELARADIQLLKVEDGMTGLGTQKAWRAYRMALREWPSTDAFPDTRPVAPDFKE